MIERRKQANNKGTFEVKYSILKPLSPNLEVLTPHGDVINPKLGQKVLFGISCTNVDRKIKIKSKRYFAVNYLFMKPLSQNFEVLTQGGDVINPKLTQKRA